MAYVDNVSKHVTLVLPRVKYANSNKNYTMKIQVKEVV